MKRRILSVAVASLFIGCSAAWCGEPSKTYFVYVSSAQTVTVLDGRTDEIIATIPVSNRPVGAHQAPGGRRVYVALNGDTERPASHGETASAPNADTVAVIDLASNSVLESIPTAARAWGQQVSPDGSKLYLANTAAGQILVVDLKSHRELKRLSVGEGPWGVMLAPTDVPPSAMKTAAR